VNRARPLSTVIGVSLMVPIACIVHMIACGDPSHIYQGRLYLEHRGCLGTTSSIDVVEGEDPGSCPALCLLQKLPDGGRAVYLSTMCAPYPFGFDTAGTDPVCAAALAALGRDDTCLTDGGSSAPAPPEAGPAEAGPEEGGPPPSDAAAD
jgi:hypothetical protein